MMENSKGKIFYGLHFYPGVAEYQEPGKEAYRVFLNENTLRQMDPTFAGRPVFVMHVDDVATDLKSLKNDADGWVVESFFNPADGKHWVKFLVCSEKAEDAIKKNWQLSNCYVPKVFANGGVWNGVSYAKEITGGEYEHLAIVPNPRYEESVIMSPEEFKKYNDDKVIELKRLSNDRKDHGMKLKFFKKAKVENTTDLEEITVVLPKTGREVTITQLVNEADKMANDDAPAAPPNLDPGGVASLKKAFQEEDGKKKDMNAGMADPEHKVKMHDGSYCNVAELVEKHKSLHDELEGMKSKKEDTEDQDTAEVEGEEDMMEDKKEDDKGGESAKDHDMQNKEDEDKKVKLVEEEEKEIKAAKQKNDKEKADRLRNAHLLDTAEVARVEIAEDRVARGKVRYGS